MLTKALAVKPSEKVLSIASAGDNSFALLLNAPSLVVAVDVSKVQLHLVALKKAAIKILDHTACLSFLGFQESDQRISDYEKLRSVLDEEALAYWDKHQDLIEEGIIHQGKFEKYFQKFAFKVLPFIHKRATVANLFQDKSAEEQLEFYHKKWNSFRWRLLFKVFFSKFVMGRLGRDPEFLKQVAVPVADFIFQQAEKELSSKKALQNSILFYNLNGYFGQHIPFYLQEANFYKIKAQLDRLVLFHGMAEEACKQFGEFDKMNLSNIFEYMSEAQFKATSLKLVNGLKEGGKLAYWNLMVDRRIAQKYPEAIKADEKAAVLKQEDMGFFYMDFILEEKL